MEADLQELILLSINAINFFNICLLIISIYENINLFYKGNLYQEFKEI